MKILHLTLHKKWFDMILSGEKKEEYRAQTDYWFKRLTDLFENDSFYYDFKKFDVIKFRNGYQKNAPSFTIELLEITEGKVNPNWCDPVTENVFILKLGKILED